MNRKAYSTTAKSRVVYADRCTSLYSVSRWEVVLSVLSELG